MAPASTTAKKIAFFAVTTLLSYGAHAASQPPVAAEHGMVVSAQRLATQVGVDVLKRGGNAFDAAVAVGYALAVVYPAAGNLGGGGFLTAHTPDGRNVFIDFREKAPLAASENMYLDAKGDVVPGLSVDGGLAVAVPGTVRGLELVREKFGTLSRADVIEPAIKLAEEGFALEAGDALMLAFGSPRLARDPAAAAIFLKEGRAYRSGEVLVQKDLARVLRAIRDRGADGFYTGDVAEKLIASVKAGGGVIVQADLDRIHPRELKPIECDYRGFRVVSPPPPSSGGVVVCEILGVLEGYPLKDYGFGSAKAVHVEIEAMRHAYVDRNAFLGDPDFVENPVEVLLSREHAAAIRAAIDPDRAADSATLKPGVAPHEGANTTHYSIADESGAAVSVTYTLNEWFGAGIVAAGTGVLLNDEMDDFTSKLGVANIFGLVQGEANAIKPGKTPLSSMSPTIVLKDGKPIFVTGTPGGSRIPTVVVHTILNVVDYGMNVQEAVDAPRVHNQWMPDRTLAERFAISPDTKRILEAMGHKFGPPQPANHAASIMIGAPALGAAPYGGNRFYGANDPRRGTGSAAGL